MRISILLTVATLCASSASAQHFNNPPVVTPLPNLTMRPTTAPVTFYLQSNFSDPDVSGLIGTQVRLNTNSGPINLEMYDTQTPITLANFLHYISSGLYNNDFVHRSVTGFLIQGGGFTYDPVTNNVPPIVAL